MATFRWRLPLIFSACWAVISALSFDTFIRSFRVIRRVAEYVASAIYSWRLHPVAEWRIIERFCSHDLREKLNIFGYHPRSTGSLCSPSL